MDVLVFRALALLGLALLVALAARRLRLPYTVGLVLAGTALAATRTNAGLALTHDLIFDVVLPPLLFEAALNLHWSDLKRDLVPVLALSTIGVALCAFVVAGGLFYALTRIRSGRPAGAPRGSAGRSSPCSSSER
jgi:CPA1 family monovalent cation:H+ antiporter